ncbi:ankyrin repeat protein [Phlyctema vagabunda]|uniref:Ankyrin repeat protein n=1 Tax=Phlyctema vagabunda TaxID=108571 RepID=A0ABR4PSB0_9HELO
MGSASSKRISNAHKQVLDQGEIATKQISSLCGAALILFQRLRELSEAIDPKDKSSETYERDDMLNLLKELDSKFRDWGAESGAFYTDNLQNFKLRIKWTRQYRITFDELNSMISYLNKGIDSRTPQHHYPPYSKGMFYDLFRYIEDEPTPDETETTPIEMYHVLSKFGNSRFCEQRLLEMLAKGITLRRKFLEFRKESYIKICKEWEETLRETTMPTEEEAAALKPSLDLVASIRMWGRPGKKRVVLEGYNSSIDRTMSEKCHEPTQPEDSDIYGLTVIPHLEWAYPNVKFKYGQQFLCPLCYTDQNVKDYNEWEKHVYKDIGPYICKRCDIYFGSQQCWSDHEQSYHHKVYTCVDCKEVFRSSEQKAYRNHLEEVHSNTHYYPTVNPPSSGYNNFRAEHCPLCDDWEKIMADDDKSPLNFVEYSKILNQHLGAHMEQLALSTLPKGCWSLA